MLEKGKRTVRGKNEGGRAGGDTGKRVKRVSSCGDGQ